MKISEVRIERFGRWRDVRLPLAPGLTVFHGPNESGKTSLLRFVRGMLYGFPPPAAPVAWGAAAAIPASGTLVVQHAGEQRSVRRAGAVNGRGVLSVSDIDPQGPSCTSETGGTDWLDRALQGISESVFENVFAVELRELQELALLSDGAVAQRIFGLTLGPTGMRLMNASRKVTERRDELIAPHQSAGRLVDLFARYDALRARFREQEDQPARHRDLLERRRRGEAAVRELKTRQAGLQEQLDGYRFLEQAFGPWRRVQECEAELEQLPQVYDFPEDGLSRLDTLDDELAAATECRDSVRAQYRQLRRDERRLRPEPALRKCLPKLRGLLAQREMIDAVREQLKSTESALEALSGGRADDVQETGKRANTEGMPDVANGHAELSAAARERQAAGLKLRRANRRWRKLREAVLRDQKEQRQTLGELGHARFEDAIAVQRKRLEGLKNLGRLRLLESQLLDRKDDLEEHRARLAARLVLPPWVYAVLSVFCFMGIVLGIAGIATGLSHSGIAGAIYALLGVTAGGLAFGLKSQFEGDSRRHLAQLMADIAENDAELRDVRAAIDECLNFREEQGPITKTPAPAAVPQPATRDTVRAGSGIGAPSLDPTQTRQVATTRSEPAEPGDATRAAKQSVASVTRVDAASPQAARRSASLSRRTRRPSGDLIDMANDGLTASASQLSKRASSAGPEPATSIQDHALRKTQGVPPAERGPKAAAPRVAGRPATNTPPAAAQVSDDGDADAWMPPRRRAWRELVRTRSAELGERLKSWRWRRLWQQAAQSESQATGKTKPGGDPESIFDGELPPFPSTANRVTASSEKPTAVIESAPAEAAPEIDSATELRLVREATDELARLEGLLKAQHGLKRRMQSLKQMVPHIRSARAAHLATKTAWSELLERHGLPPDASPAAAFSAWGRQQSQHDVRRDAEHLESRRTELQALWQQCETRLHEVARAIPQLPGMSPNAMLEAGENLLSQLRQQSRQRRALRQQMKDKRRECAEFRRMVDDLQSQRHSLLAHGGASERDEFEQRAEWFERRLTLLEERDAARRELADIARRHSDLAVVEEDLMSFRPDENRRRIDTLAQEADDLAADLLAVSEQLGRCKQELEWLEGDTAPGELRLQAAELMHELRRSAQAWFAAQLAGQTLQAVQRDYERHCQPAVLQAASRLLERLTLGRYRRVWTPLDRRQLLVDDEFGEPLPVEYLSRGTREQLLLAVRLAAVEQLSQQGIELPMVLDDVFVNFDERRAAAAADVLLEFAGSQRQVLVFTCHEYLAQLFEHRQACVVRLAPEGLSADQRLAS